MSTVNVNYTITAITTGGADTINVAYTLTESVSATTVSYKDTFSLDSLTQGVTTGMTSIQATTQMKNNFLTLISAKTCQFATAAKELIEAQQITTNLAGVTGVEAMSYIIYPSIPQMGVVAVEVS